MGDSNLSEMKTTRTQERAQAAFKAVMEIKGEKWSDDYGRQCLNLPALIHQCGLCQALAFLVAKGADEEKKPYFKKLLNDLALTSKLSDIRDWETLTQQSREVRMQEYQRMSREILSCALWFKRYAEAVLKVEPGGEKADKQ